MVTALAWTQERINPPEDNRIAAVLRCGATACKSVIRVPLMGFGGAPEWITKMIARKGWYVDPHRQAKCRCPSCLKKGGHSGGAKKATAILDAIETHFTPPGTTQTAKTVFPGVSKEESNVVTTATVSTPTFVDIKSIPAAMKTRIRQKLDALFDDSAGAYLNGATDQSIAKELGIGASFVYSLRETAYGPIKRDPELDDVLTKIEALKKTLAETQSDIAKLETRVSDCLRRLGL